MRQPGTVKYRVGKEVLEFSYAHGHNGYGGMDWDGDYYEFTAADGQKLKIKPNKLAAGEKKRLDDEWHKKPYRDELANLAEITLYERDRNDFDGLPSSTEYVWEIDSVTSHSWIIELTDGVVLHVLNNPEVTIRGTTFARAMRKLFPGKKITVYRPTVHEEVIE